MQTLRRSAIVWNRREELAKRQQASIQAKVEACANSVDVAVLMHSTAVKHFAATEIAAVQLIKHVDTRSSFTAMPKVERDTRVISVSRLDAEQAQAIHMRKQP